VSKHGKEVPPAPLGHGQVIGRLFALRPRDDAAATWPGAERGLSDGGAEAAHRQGQQRTALRRPAQLHLRGQRQHRRVAEFAGLR